MEKEKVISIKDAFSRVGDWKITNAVNIHNKEKWTKDGTLGDS